MASAKWHGDRAKREIREAIAKGLLRGAVFLQTEHKKLLNVSNPRPYLNSSKPGEYPRARTGFGRDNTTYEPVSIDAVARSLSVRVGYFKNAFYMLSLELYRQRKGLVATLDKFRKSLDQIVTGK